MHNFHFQCLQSCFLFFFLFVLYVIYLFYIYLFLTHFEWDEKLIFNIWQPVVSVPRLWLCVRPPFCQNKNNINFWFEYIFANLLISARLCTRLVLLYMFAIPFASSVPLTRISWFLWRKSFADNKEQISKVREQQQQRQRGKKAQSENRRMNLSIAYYHANGEGRLRMHCVLFTGVHMIVFKNHTKY